MPISMSTLQCRFIPGLLLTAGLATTAPRAVATPLFAPFLSFDAGDNPTSVAIGDLNGDGKLDLAVANFVSNTVSVLLGDAEASFGAKTDYGTGDHPHSVAIRD